MTMTTTPVWDIFELRLSGPATGNPYLDVTLEAHFTQRGRSIRVPGFYDGEGQYVLRFMPDTQGEWHYKTRSSLAALEGKVGSFTATTPLKGAHGPVRVANQFHFAHADGKPFLCFGTTCYAWTHQPLELQAQTLNTLTTAGFNKIRMGVFPKDYPFNTNEPLHDVFDVGADGKRDFDRPNPVAFRHFESQIGKLRDLGIEADIIIFHPYDRWGYCDMSAEQDNRYVAYLAARLAAYRNVWWSLANEYDFLLDTKPMERWDRFFHILGENDPYGHLRSIHNGDVRMNYDHTKPWVTHVCIQNWDVKKTPEWRDAYGKPVVNDEPEYEGNIFSAWGNISAQELTHRFWITALRGGYAGHGETFEHPEDIIWWAKGGELYGDAWKRIKFLRELLEQDVKAGLTPLGGTTSWPWSRMSAAEDGDVRYIYFGEHQPAQWTTGLPLDDGDYDVDLIDTWAMTIEPAQRIAPAIPHPTRHGAVVRGGKADAAFGVRLPGRPHLALRVRRRR
ncbi:DUF5060 domain-containing protein [Devosia equisanguinis]|nr:DUF5060 domain-containing protein [Devosia equisanguinis]